MKNSNLKRVEEILTSVGKTTFIKYFEVFESNAFDKSNNEIIHAFQHEKWETASENNKASQGKNIFKENLVKEALQNIIDSKINNIYTEKAKNILHQRYGKEKWDCTVSCYAGSIKEVAYKIVTWMIDIEELRNALEKGLTEINSRSNNPNIIKSYSFKEIGHGAFFTCFMKEPTKEELTSGGNLRYDESSINISNLSDSIIKSDYTYLSNQWTYEKSNLCLSELIEFINRNLPQKQDVRIDLKKVGEEYHFYSYEKNETIDVDDATIESEYSTEEKNKHLEKINNQIDIYKVKPLKTTKRITDGQLYQNFKTRLKTQNRRYNQSKECFYHTIINRLYPQYNKWIEDQLSTIIAYDETGKEEIEVLGFDKYYIKDGDFYGYNNEKKMIKFYFKVGDVTYPFKDFITRLEDISLEHVTPMKSILKLEERPALKTISDIIFANENLNPKLGSDLDTLEKLIREKNKHSTLKEELDDLIKEIKLVLLPGKINSAKGCN